MQKIVLNSCSLAELVNLSSSMGERPYRAGQIYRWLYYDKVTDINNFTNLSVALRESIANLATITVLEEKERALSKDGSAKFIFKLPDGHFIESVLLAAKDGDYSGCISSQAGCRMGCTFCATALLGFKRSLTVAEMLEQVRLLEVAAGGKLKGLVFMGMGEPTDNLANLLKTLEILVSDKGYGYSRRKITVSTTGNIPAMTELMRIDNPVNLAVSLNAADNDTRKNLMPISNKYSLENLVIEIKKLPIEKRRRITIEYVLLSGINDSEKDARKLSKLINKLPVKINLIRYNQIGNGEYKKPAETKVLAFQKILTEAGLATFIRKSIGSDVSGACGQLALKMINPPS